MAEGNGNGNFLRTLFWALLIGSFGWTTFIGWGTLQAITSHCDQQKTEFTEVRKEVMMADNAILSKLSEKMEAISASIAELKTEVKYLRREKV